VVNKVYVVHGMTENTTLGETVLLVTFDERKAEEESVKWLRAQHEKGKVADVAINTCDVDHVYEVL
jgi:hypothetical protein